MLFAGGLLVTSCGTSGGRTTENLLPVGHPAVPTPTVIQVPVAPTLTDAVLETMESDGFTHARAIETSPHGSRGEALEVLTGGGYTYVHVQIGDEDIWIAGQGAAVRTGETVAWIGGLRMGEFRSATLDRTFGDILFVSRILVVQ